MASQMDSRLSFSCQRFDDLFAGSPRAKEIFASFYKNNGNTWTESREEDCTKQVKGPGLLTGRKHFYNTRTMGGLNASASEILRAPSDNQDEMVRLNEKDEILTGSPTGIAIPDNISKEINAENTHVLRTDISLGEGIQEDVDNQMENCNEQVNMALKKLDNGMITSHEEGAKSMRKVKEHVLGNWSLQSVEINNNEKEVIVEGHRSTDPQMQNWRSTVICERVSARCVKTKSGSLYHLSGSIDEMLMNEKGFPIWLTKAFKNGFPSKWKNLLQKHYKEMKSLPPSDKSEKKETRQNAGEKTDDNNPKVKNEVKKEPRKTRKTKKEVGQSENEKVQVVKKTKRKTSQNSAFLTPPTSVLPKEHDIKRSRSGRIIAPPLEYWRGQRIISNEHNESIAIVKCHLEEDTMQLLPNKKTPPCRTYLNLEGSWRKKQPQKGRQRKNTQKETTSDRMIRKEGVALADIASTISSDIDSTTCTTDELISTDGRTISDINTVTETTGSDSIPTSTVVKTLSYTNSDGTTDGTIGDSKLNKQTFSKRNVLTCQTKMLLDENCNHTRHLRSRSRASGQEKRQTSSKANSLVQNNERVSRRSESSADDSSNIDKPRSFLQPRVTMSRKKIRAQSLDSGSNTHAEMLRKQSKDSDFESSDTEFVKNVKRESRKRATSYTSLNELELGKRSKILRSSKRQKVTTYETNTEGTLWSSNEGIPRQPTVEYGSKTQNNMADDVEEEVSGETENRSVSPARVVATTSLQPTQSVRSTYLLRPRCYPVHDNATMTEGPLQRRHKESTDQVTDDGKKELRNPRKVVATDKVDKKVPSRKRAKTKKVLKPAKSTVMVQTTSEEMWSDEEKDKLIQALSQIPPATAMYWQKVAHVVKTRNAEECQLYIQKDGIVKNQKKKARRKNEEKVVCTDLTAKAGSLARVWQLRNILDQNDDGHEDDYFDSTPFRNQKIIKFSPVDLDADEIASEEADTSQPGYITPFSRTPMNRLRPAGPLTASGKSESDYVSPGELLQTVNRNEIDRYVHQIKNRKRGRHVKSVKSHTPVSKKTSNPHPLSFNDGDCFDIREVRSDPEEEEDYYWSDE